MCGRLYPPVLRGGQYAGHRPALQQDGLINLPQGVVVVYYNFFS